MTGDRQQGNLHSEREEKQPLLQQRILITAMIPGG